jgi:hypothetical protein
MDLAKDAGRYPCSLSYMSLRSSCINLQNVNPRSPRKKKSSSMVVIKMHLLCSRCPFCYNLISYKIIVSCRPYWHFHIRTRWLINLKPQRICLLGHQILVNYLHSVTPRALWRSEWRAQLSSFGSVIHRLITSLLRQWDTTPSYGPNKQETTYNIRFVR